MKSKWNVMGWIVLFLILLEFIVCESSYKELRKNNQHRSIDVTKKFDKFGSFERIRLRRTVEIQKFPTINNFRLRIGESGTSVKNTQEEINVKRFPRVDLSRETPSLKRNLRLSIRERIREPSSVFKKEITETRLSSNFRAIEDNSKKVRQLTKSSNGNDRRISNGMANRLLSQIRGNRLRNDLSSKRSIVSQLYKREKQIKISNNENVDFPSQISELLKEAVIKLKPSGCPRKEHLGAIFYRSNNKENSNQRIRNDRRENYQIKNRDNRRRLPNNVQERRISATRISKFDAQLKQEFQTTRPEFRRRFIASRRQLQEGERIKSENRRRLLNNVQERVGKHKNIEQTTGNRRNGRGYRGRVENRESLVDRKEYSTSRITLSKHRLDSNKLKDTEKFMLQGSSRHRRFTSQGKHLSSESRQKRVLMSMRFDNNIRQTSEAHKIREIRNARNRERFTIFTEKRKLTLRIDNSAKLQNTLSIMDSRFMPHNLDTARITLVDNKNAQRNWFSHNRNQNMLTRSREISLRRTIKDSIGNRKLIFKNTDSPISSILTSRMSMRVENRRVGETSLNRFSNFINRRVTDRWNSRRFVESKLTVRLGMESFLEKELPLNSFNNRRNMKITDFQRETSGKETNTRKQKYRSNKNREQRSVNENRYQVRQQISRNNRFSTIDAGRRTIIQSNRMRETHRNKNNLYTNFNNFDDALSHYRSIRSLNTYKMTRNSDSATRRLRTRRSRTEASIPSILIGSIENNSSENICTPKNSIKKDFCGLTPTVKNSMKLLASHRTEKLEFRDTKTLERNDRARWTLNKYILEKRSYALSFVFNVILGLTAFIFMSEDINKGLFSRMKNQIQHSILQYINI